MTQKQVLARTAKASERLDAQISSGRPLSLEALAHHLNVDENKARQIVKGSLLEREGSTYPWRRIWRAIHSTEGSQLPRHLTHLKELHPASVILESITDLEAELRRPLIDFATMARLRGKRPDTLAKALRQGRENLPYPLLEFGPRRRMFRELEVRLWEEEGILLDLPRAAISPVSKSEPAANAKAQTAQDQPDFTSPEGRRKVLFSANRAANRRSAD